MPNKPTKAYIDSDVMLFQAASAGEKVNYVYYDGSVPVARFESAKDGKNWLAEMELLGCDPEFGFGGDPDTLTRETEWVDVGFDECKEAWNSSFEFLEKDLLKWSPDIKITTLISPATGVENFRYAIADLKPYKGDRSKTRKPKYLEQTREYVQSLPNVKSPKSKLEIDDWCLAYAQRDGQDGLAVAIDKDVRTAKGCWVYHYGDMDEPEWSDDNTVGYVDWDGKKMRGLGYLFLLYQTCSGDSCDGYSGIPKFGAAKSFKLLSPYNNKPLSEMDQVLKACLVEYEKGFGKEYVYKSCLTGDNVTAAPYDLMKQNLSLAYMLKGSKDSAEKSVLKYLNREYV